MFICEQFSIYLWFRSDDRPNFQTNSTVISRKTRETGMYSSPPDRADRLGEWEFPAMDLPAGRSVVVFASGKDRAVSGSEDGSEPDQGENTP